MTAGFIDAYRSANIPINEVPDTASIIAQVACEGTVNGEAFYLEGGRAWAFEGRIEGLKGQWLGEGLVGDIMKGGAILAAVSSFLGGDLVGEMLAMLMMMCRIRVCGIGGRRSRLSRLSDVWACLVSGVEQLGGARRMYFGPQFFKNAQLHHGISNA